MVSPDPPESSHRVIWLVIALTAIALAGFIVYAQARYTGKTSEAEAAKAVATSAAAVATIEGQRADEGQDLAEQLTAACAADKIKDLALCQTAATVASGTPIPGPSGASGSAGRPPTAAEIAAAVEAYLAQNPPPSGPTGPEGEPGPTPTLQQIVSAVAVYLASHPAPAGPQGEPGPGPSQEQINAAVAAYIAENPPSAGPAGPSGATGPEGPAGPSGETGRPPTAEEIQAAVAAYLTDHPLPVCPEGTAAEQHTVLTTGGPIAVVVCVVT